MTIKTSSFTVNENKEIRKQLQQQQQQQQDIDVCNTFLSTTITSITSSTTTTTESSSLGGMASDHQQQHQLQQHPVMLASEEEDKCRKQQQSDQLVSLPVGCNEHGLEENMPSTVAATTTILVADDDDVSITTSSLGTALLPSADDSQQQQGQPQRQSEILDFRVKGSIPFQRQQQPFQPQGLQESRKTGTRQSRRRHSEQMHNLQMHFSMSALHSPLHRQHHRQEQQQQQQHNTMWIDKFSKSWSAIFSIDNNDDEDDDFDYNPPVLENSTSPSSTLHVRPRLFERAMMAEECQQRQQKSASSLLDGANHHVPTTTPTSTTTTNTQQEDASCDLSVSGTSLDLEDILATTAAEATTTTTLDDPFQIACKAARTQYQQDYENSRIADKSHKFPQFDVKEIHLGRLLGKGSFAQVLEVKGFSLTTTTTTTSTTTTLLTSSTASSDLVHSVMGTSKMAPTATDGMEVWGEELDGSYIETAPLKGGEEEVMDPITTESTTEEVSRELGYDDITDDELDLLDDVDDGEKRDKFVSTSRSSSCLLRPSLQDTRQRHLITRSTSSMDSSRHFIASHCHRSSNSSSCTTIKTGFRQRRQDNQPPMARYALKQLKSSVTESPHSLLQGMADMATETRVLSSLTDHPNVIKLRGIARGSDMPFRNDYFILVDRLYDTLEVRIQKWKKQQPEPLRWTSRNVLGRLFQDTTERRGKKQLWLDRLYFAYDVSSALAYLHNKHVIHRDLKPANIGFDLRDDIKIFDFGLAKELPTIHNGPQDVFHFTAMCGSPRYMAPEVATEEPYNELCDVYSFGVLIWQMMSLSKPYDNISLADLQRDVWKNDESARRPSPSLVDKGGRFLNKRGWRRSMLRLLSKSKHNKESSSTPSPHSCRGSPASLQSLLESCWSYRLEDRPSMQQVENRLKDEILSFQTIHGDCTKGESDRRLSHTRRRSTFVLETEEEQEYS